MPNLLTQYQAASDALASRAQTIFDIFKDNNALSCFSNTRGSNVCHVDADDLHNALIELEDNQYAIIVEINYGHDCLSYDVEVPAIWIEVDILDIEAVEMEALRRRQAQDDKEAEAYKAKRQAHDALIASLGLQEKT